MITPLKDQPVFPTIETVWRTDDGWKTHKGSPIVLEMTHKDDPKLIKNTIYSVTRCPRCDYKLNFLTHTVTRWLILPP